MSASAIRTIYFSPNKFRHWLRGQHALAHLMGIFVLAAASLAICGFAVHSTWDARSWVQHTNQVQDDIDKIVWDLLTLQQAAQSQRLNQDPDQIHSFNRIRADVVNDTRAVIQLTPDNFYLQGLLAQFDEALSHYLTSLDRLANTAPGNGVGRSLATVMSAEAGRIAALIGTMRAHEDGLLEKRSTRADRMMAVLLPMLCLTAAFIAMLSVMAGQIFHRLMRERDDKLSAKEHELAASKMLMREVDHRVRNSLGLVYNLMTFRGRGDGIDPHARALITETANQILVVARLHGRLYQPESSAPLSIGTYLRELCDDLADYSLPDRAAIRVNAVEADLPPEPLVWLGLLVVEFVTNALKHSHPTPDEPVVVDVTAMDHELRVSVSDHGEGLPANFDVDGNKGLGMQMIGVLVKQLRGTLKVDREWAGARFVVTMPTA